MKPEIKKLWVEALRSGEFDRGECTLRKIKLEGDKYCCLGVLCELHRRHTNGPDWEQEFNDPENGTMVYCGQNGYLPEEVQKWAELDPNPKIKGTQATTWNDILAKDFKVIADLIDENL